MTIQSNTELAAVILAAGRGTRMKSGLPKVLHKVAGRPMVAHVAATASQLEAEHIVVVTATGMTDVYEAATKTAPKAKHAVQTEQLGTGDAVKAAADILSGFKGAVMVLYGDTPLINPETLHKMIESLQQNSIVVLGMRPENPATYGRLIVTENGLLEKIVEYKDANPAEKAVNLCNSGVMIVADGQMFNLLDKLGNDNASGEYYLTDIVAIATERGLRCGVVEADENELLGVNSRRELSIAENVFQTRKRESAMREGATLIDPETVYFSSDTKLGRDVIIEPNVFFGENVTVGDNVHIRSFSHIDGATIGAGAVVGPFARLRPDTELGENVRVGNFVEVKKSKLANGVKAGHLSYIGDASIGENTNIGAGTITCNYDGVNKYKTTIGKDVFVGSDSTLVAPVQLGDGSFVAAGSCITDDIPQESLGIARGRQFVKNSWKLND